MSKIDYFILSLFYIASIKDTLTSRIKEKTVILKQT